MQVRVDVTCIYINFGGRGLYGFGVKIWQNFPFGPWTIVHGDQKIKSTQKFYASRG